MRFAMILKDEPFIVAEHCCSEMSVQANMHCNNAENKLTGSTDKRIYWSPIFNEYGLICQPSFEILIIHHCPFCGELLPQSKRDKWFERLASTGWRDWSDPIPAVLLRSDWDNA